MAQGLMYSNPGRSDRTANQGRQAPLSGDSASLRSFQPPPGFVSVPRMPSQPIPVGGGGFPGLPPGVPDLPGGIGPPGFTGNLPGPPGGGLPPGWSMRNLPVAGPLGPITAIPGGPGGPGGPGMGGGPGTRVPHMPGGPGMVSGPGMGPGQFSYVPGGPGGPGGGAPQLPPGVDLARLMPFLQAMFG